MSTRGGPLRADVIGLIPAGGQATRIAPLPCSKELYPIGFRPADDGHGLRSKAVSHYLLEKMKLAGIIKAYIVLRPGKWDIPAYFGNGALLDMHLAYLMAPSTLGVPYTLDQAYPFVRDTMVAFGFPDILFQPDNAFVQLLDCQRTIDADILLGLFPTDSPQNEDIVDLDDNARVQQILIKPQHTHLRYTWGIALWKPVFTEFMHNYLSVRQESSQAQPELTAGAVIQAAIQNDLRVNAVLVSKDPYLDIGTPDSLVEATRRFAAQ